MGLGNKKLVNKKEGYETAPAMLSATEEIVAKEEEAMKSTTDNTTPVPTQMEHEENAPKDRFRLVYLTFYLMGIGTLFPWNVFITANDYFMARFAGSSFSESFQSYFGISYMLAFVVTLLATLKFQQRWNIDFRVVIPLVFIFLIFLLSTIFVKIQQLRGANFFYCNIVFILLCGMTSAFFQSGIIGFASQMPSIYVQSVMTGQALAGVAVAAAGFFTALGDSGKVPGGNAIDTSTSTMVYFIVAVVVILACFFGYVYIRRHPLTTYYVTKAKMHREEEARSAVSIEKDSDRASVVRTESRPTIRSVLRDIWDLGLGAFLVFCVTLSVFPSIVVKVASVNEGGNFFANVLFVPFGFLVFNLGDFLGRSLTGIRWFSALPKFWLHVLTITRLVFIPIFMICNIQSTNTKIYTPSLIRSDAAFFIFYALFGISNGYLGTLHMIKAPGAVSDDAKELVGLVMVLCLISGLTTGSFLSFFFRWIVCRCNPFG